MIVLTLNPLEAQRQLIAEQKMLLLRTREKRKGGLSCLPQGSSPWVIEICNIHLHHQALWLGYNKEKSFSRKRNVTAISGAPKDVWVLGTGLGPNNGAGMGGQLSVCPESCSTEGLGSDMQSLSPFSHTRIMTQFSGVWKWRSYRNLMYVNYLAFLHLLSFRWANSHLTSSSS